MSKIHLKSFGLKSHGVISMALKSVFYFSFLILPLFTLFSSCAISYKFNGASIDYSKTKTIQIDPFPIRSTYVWAPMQSIFNNKLTDLYAQQTKLKQVKRGGTS